MSARYEVKPVDSPLGELHEVGWTDDAGVWHPCPGPLRYDKRKPAQRYCDVVNAQMRDVD